MIEVRSVPVSNDAVLDRLRDAVLPLVAADGAHLYLVSAGDDEIKVHLAGAYAGCPGVTLVARGVIEPALAPLGAGRVTVTSGWVVPAGAVRVEPARKA